MRNEPRAAQLVFKKGAKIIVFAPGEFSNAITIIPDEKAKQVLNLYFDRQEWEALTKAIAAMPELKERSPHTTDDPKA